MILNNSPGGSQENRSRKTLYGFSVSASSALAYAALPILAKAAFSRGIAPVELLSLRFLFALPLFWGFSLLFRRDSLAVGWLKGISITSAGFFLFGAASIAMFHAFRLIEASLAIILLYTYPPLVALWDRLVSGEKLSGVKTLSLAAAFTGVVLMVGGPALISGGSSIAGILLALLAALLYSIFSFTAQRLSRDTGPLVFATYMVTGTFLLTAFLEPPLKILRDSGMEVLGLAMVLAWVCTYLFLGERLSGTQAAGGLLILGGVYLLLLDRGKE